MANLKAKGDKHQGFKTHQGFVSIQSLLSPVTASLPCISKDECALLDRTGFSKVSL